MAGYRKRKNEAGRKGIICVVLIVVIVVSVNIINLYQKDQEYAAKEAELIEQLETEKAREKQLSEYEAYIGSREYVESTAKSKLGLLYDNEIIFREK